MAAGSVRGSEEQLAGAAERLRRAGEEATAAAECYESQFLRHADKAGVVDSSREHARRCLEEAAQALGEVSAQVCARAEAVSLAVGQLEAAAGAVVQMARMERLSGSLPASEAGEAAPEQRHAIRGPPSFELPAEASAYRR
mmetsp:Transcript_14122/g.36241  ORF Transcript_14122/g.36241 Transcript_14122/m.36241 type:complete len:141 (-) Transcript_14122:406-828(-)|eukprot:jgi/Tetstr1/430325/TSEL_020150.t1